MPGEPLAEAVVKISADKSDLNSAIEGVKNDVKKLDAPIGGLKAKLKALKERGGEDSTLGQTAKLFAGAGAVAAVSLIGQELAKATAKAVELSTAYRRGEADASAIAVGIGESIPVIGGFVTAGQNIRELFTHEKAELQEINDSIALGTKLMQLRQQAYEGVRSATRQMAEEATGYRDKALLLNTHGDKAKEAVQVDIEYRSNTRKLEEETRVAIEARKKILLQAQEEIEAGYQKGPKTDDAMSTRNEKMRATQRAAAKDIKTIEDASKDASRAMHQWHDAAVQDAQGIRKELEKFAAEASKKLAITDAEKITDYAGELQRAGYNAQQAAPLIQAFGRSLKIERYADAKQEYQDILKQINTIGTTARETALNEFWSKLAGSRYPHTELKQFADAYDYLQAKIKQASVGDLIKQMGEQVATFGTTPMEALKKKLDFNFADPSQRQVAIELQIKIEGQEKAQKVADLIKGMKEQAQTFDFTPLEQLKRKLDLLNASPGDRQKAIELQVVITQQEKAQQLFETIKGINEAFKDTGKTDLQKQIDQMTRLAQETGVAAGWVGAIADAKAKLERMKVNDFVRDTNKAREDIGKSEPDKAVSDLKAAGVTDPKLLGEAWTAAAKKAGAELAHSLQTPFEKYTDKMKDLEALKKAGAIDDKTFRNAKAEAGKDYQSAMGGAKSLEQAFKDNLSKQFMDFGLGKQKKDAEDAVKKAAEEARKKNTKAVADNTDALKKAADAFTKGIAGTFA